MSPTIKTSRQVRSLESQKKHKQEVRKLDKTKKMKRKKVEGVASRLHSSELEKAQRLEEMRQKKLVDEQKAIDALMNQGINGKKKKRVRLDADAMESSMERLFSKQIATQAPPMKKHEDDLQKHAMKMVNSGARGFATSLRGGAAPKSSNEVKSTNADGSWKAPPPKKDDKPGFSMRDVVFDAAVSTPHLTLTSSPPHLTSSYPHLMLT